MQPCTLGTFSLGGGYRLQTWTSWPTCLVQFQTYCLDGGWAVIPSNECAGWSLNDIFIESNIARLHNTKSVLQTDVTVINNGSVSYIAQVDCEYNYDNQSKEETQLFLIPGCKKREGRTGK